MNRFTAHIFPGTDPEFVLIIAGIHNSEQGGIEIAHWIRTKLAARKKPTRLGAIVIPEIFPDRALQARAAEWNVGPGRWNAKNGVGDDYREHYPDDRHPARHFPPPGQPLAFLDKDRLKDLNGTDLVDARGRPIPLLAEIKHLVQLIEAVKQVRIVSIHGKRRRTRADLDSARKKKIINMTDDQLKDWDGSAVKGVNFAGIFVDPRYSVCHTTGFELEDCKFDFAADPAYPAITAKNVPVRFDSAKSTDGRVDDALALKMAQAVKDPTLVAGNHLNDPPEVVHYAKEDPGVPGYTLGDWGPVDVTSTTPTPGLPPSFAGARHGAPVFTIEVDQNHESWAFLDGVQYMDEKGNPIPQPKRPSPRLRPARFDPPRSRQLQDYAQAIVDVGLA